jgi:hypothetical protein
MRVRATEPDGKIFGPPRKTRGRGFDSLEPNATVGTPDWGAPQFRLASRLARSPRTVTSSALRTGLRLAFTEEQSLLFRGSGPQLPGTSFIFWPLPGAACCRGATAAERHRANACSSTRRARPDLRPLYPACRMFGRFARRPARIGSHAIPVRAERAEIAHGGY